MESKKSVIDITPDGPVYSKVFDFGPTKYKFRLLNCDEQIWGRTAAQAATLDMLTDVFDADIALTLMTTHGPNADTQLEFEELYALQAALCTVDGAPIVHGDANERVRQLAKKFTPIERHELAGKYAEAADEHDPNQISDDEIGEIVADGNPTADGRYWQQFGSNALRRCALTMARELSVLRAGQMSEATDVITELSARVTDLEQCISQTPKSGDGID